MNQVSSDFIGISILFAAASVMAASISWGILAVVRMLQITIATNVTLSRELSAINQALGANIPGGTTATGIPAKPPKPGKADGEGEFVPYDEEELYRQEEILRQHLAAKEANGLSDEALNEAMQKAVNTAVD